ncbi:MAG: response regulator [Acidobacteriota bacterium]
MIPNPRSVVLSVKDDDNLRDAVADVLKEEGYEVAHARNGAEALDTLRRRRGVCAILLEMRMP